MSNACDEKIKMEYGLKELVEISAIGAYVHQPGEDIERWLLRLRSDSVCTNEALAIFKSLIRTRGVKCMARVYLATGFRGNRQLMNILAEKALGLPESEKRERGVKILCDNYMREIGK